MISPQLSKTFTLLRFPMAVMVVWLHISPNIYGEYVVIMGYGQTPGEVFYTIVSIIGSLICSCAVPCFFFISGYLLFHDVERWSWKGYILKLRNRFYSLFIPYLIWNLLAYCYIYTIVEPAPFTFESIFWEPANFPLWFIRNLIIAVLCSPLFYFVAKKCGVVGLVGLLIAFINIPSHIIPHFALVTICFFFLGIYWSMSPTWAAKLERSSLGVWILNLLFLGILVYLTLNYGKFPYQINRLFLLTGAVAFLVDAHTLICNGCRPIATWLTECTFFIFVAHKVGPTALSKLPISYLGLSETAQQLVVYLLCPILTVGICVVLYHLLKRISPGVVKLINGNK